MKNRYLLLVTLIIGLTGQTAQAADTFKRLYTFCFGSVEQPIKTADTAEAVRALPTWPAVSKIAWNNVLSQHSAITKPAAILYAPPARLDMGDDDSKIKGERILAYRTIGAYLQRYGIKPEYTNWYLKKVESAFTHEAKKYDAEFAMSFKWRLSIYAGWRTYYDPETNDQFIGIPPLAVMPSVIHGKDLSSDDLGGFHHERTHFLEEHSKRAIKACNQTNDREALNNLCIHQEWEADEGIPNNPKLLYGQRECYAHLDHINFQQCELHPLHNDRSARFAERLSKLRLSHDVRDDQERIILGIPPHLECERPREKAIAYGLDQDYYANRQEDMKDQETDDFDATAYSFDSEISTICLEESQKILSSLIAKSTD